MRSGCDARKGAGAATAHFVAMHTRRGLQRFGRAHGPAARLDRRASRWCQVGSSQTKASDAGQVSKEQPRSQDRAGSSFGAHSAMPIQTGSDGSPASNATHTIAPTAGTVAAPAGRHDTAHNG